jgi:hypothetical protein
MKTTFLALSWAVSRGADTYGYNICRLDDSDTDKRYRCMGGGYDMIGTVFGNWLKTRFADRLAAADIAKYYGARKRDDGSISLDGACGLESMLDIAKVIGLSTTRTSNRKGHTTGFIVTDTVNTESGN